VGVLAIAIQTVRGSLRSHVYHVLLALIALAVFGLPLTVSGDGTAVGQLQVALTYSLGAVTALVSTAALWLSCATLAREIEGYQIHLVVTKPVRRFTILAGKFLGVFAVNALVFAVGAAVIYGLVLWRLGHGDFSPKELQRVRNEVLVGRRLYMPEQPDFKTLVDQEYERRKREGKVPPDAIPTYTKELILSELKARLSEVRYGETRVWVYRGVRKPRSPDTPLYLRYRMYIGSTESLVSQRETDGVWSIRDPNDPRPNAFVGLPRRVMTGRFHEFRFPARFIDDDGTVVVAYTNRDPQKSPVNMQLADGPQLLLAETGFFSNYFRAGVLVFLQLAFLTLLGTVVGALFSTPVAVFVAVAYLLIGFVVKAAVRAPLRSELGEYEYKNVAERLTHYLAIGVNHVVVSVDEFDASSYLARGRLVPWRRVALAFGGLVVLRGGILCLIGTWIFDRRELGTVIRR